MPRVGPCPLVPAAFVPGALIVAAGAAGRSYTTTFARVSGLFAVGAAVGSSMLRTGPLALRAAVSSA